MNSDNYCICKIFSISIIHLVAEDCATANVGSSGHNTKTVTIGKGFSCPSFVDQLNWIDPIIDHGESSSNFTIKQVGTKLTVKRFDCSECGWTNQLKFKCCKRGTF